MKDITFILSLMLSGGSGGERLNPTFFLSPPIVSTIPFISKEVRAGEIAWKPSRSLACEMHGYAYDDALLEHQENCAALDSHHCSGSAHLASLHIEAHVSHCDSHGAQPRPRHG